MRISTVCTALLLIAVVAACVNQPVAPAPTSIGARVQPGNLVQLVRSDGTKGQYRVVDVRDDALGVRSAAGNRAPVESIPYSEIRELKVTRLNTQAIGTGLTVAGVVLALSTLWALPYAAPAPCC